MLTAVIHSSTVEGMHKQMLAAGPNVAAFEWRVDALGIINFDELKALRESWDSTIIITLRSVGQGGASDLAAHDRLLALIAFASLKPAFIDLECCDDDALIERIAKSFPDIQIIRSFHDFDETPEDLHGVLDGMRHNAVDIYKIIGFAKGVMDGCRMIDFVSKANKADDIAGHCMGPIGSFTRVLADSMITYSEVPTSKLSLVGDNENTNVSPAPGIISTVDFLDIYRIFSKDQGTGIYALLGNPVDASVGHKYHNDRFFNEDKDCIYVKIPIDEGELNDFLTWAKISNVKGLSITMPHKESIIPFVDHLDEKAKSIGAVNTLKIENGKIYATNTDGTGALDPIEELMPVSGKSMLILGAGGAAKAIAYEATHRGANVTIINRTEDKAETLANALGCGWITKEDILGNLKNKFDILVNCLPQSATDFLDRKNIIDKSLNDKGLVMDVTYGLGSSALLNHAKSLGLLTVTGDKMFVRQAELQQAFWQA
jgi:3-dehydroquinate dehydratase/shikimate dehydrogenase